MSVVFVLALVLFGYITNRGTPELTADMDGATLPRIYFREGGYEVNPLMGYVDEMSVPAVRDTITPLKSNGSLDIRIAGKDVKIKKLIYEILSLDGKKSFGKKEVGKVKEQMTLNVSEGLNESEEAVLKITLVTADKKKVDYYTRIINQDDLHVNECLDFVTQFHTSVMETKESGEISRYLEPDPTADNGTFQHVTLRSDLNHITWGELDPEIVGDIDWNIKETNGVYTAVQLKYQVKRLENDLEKRYNVKEFFKVRYNKERMYLLDYDRTMDEVFDRSGSALDEKGILLGITDKDITYNTNKDGSVLSFVQERELWNYDKEADRLSLVFSFRSEENDDVRNRYDQHEIKIISMDKNGSTTFAVYGYMNRGAHEGQVGVAVYYFDIEQNTVAEKAFIPSNKSFLIAEDELGKLVYYNNKGNMLYVMVDGTLFKVNLEDGKKEKIVKGLEDGQYVASDDGHLLAYQEGLKTQITLFNFLTDKKYKIEEKSGDKIVPLDFVLNDFVYGFTRDGEKGKTISGETVTPMYKLEIRDSKNKVAKTYEEADIYVLDIIIENNMVTLNRVTKKGDLYTGVTRDYITNNEEREDQGVSLKSVSTEHAGRKMYFEYEKELNANNTKILMPKQVLLKIQRRFLLFRII